VESRIAQDLFTAFYADMLSSARGDLAEQLAVIEDLRKKIDVYKIVLDQLDLQDEFFSKKIESLTKSRTTIRRSVERIKENLKKIMLENETTRLEGFEYRLDLRTSIKTEMVSDVPTDMDRIHYPQFVRSKFEWDKKAVTDAIKLSDPNAAELAKRVETSHIKFTVRTMGDE